MNLDESRIQYPKSLLEDEDDTDLPDDIEDDDSDEDEDEIEE